jgi:L-seryl-tRNA(Ser) seleniumtransferase
VAALRGAAEALRQRLAAGEVPPADVGEAIERELPARLVAIAGPTLRPVINATGVIVHTNLGRAPLAGVAVARIAAIGGYSNLEYDLASGARGRRDVHAERLLCHLTGAEAAVVVNNNAAATLVTLAAIAAGREVIISRGELVEIGGGFRVPDVMAQSGALLREVGTTNRTRVADYAAAISERTAAILRVHPSNFRIEGFTERPAARELAALAHRFQVPVIEDIGSGWCGPLPPPRALGDEPAPRASLAAGIDLVLFSGDKLLGGPQAGIIAGSASLVSTVRRHPLMRALRVDKLTYAALEATLQEHAAGRAAETVPVMRMIAMMSGGGDRDACRADGSAAHGRLRRGDQRRLDDRRRQRAGIHAADAPGGTQRIPRSAPTALEARLRAMDPPIIARIEQDRVVLDLRTVPPEQDELLLALLETLVARSVSSAPNGTEAGAYTQGPGGIVAADLTVEDAFRAPDAWRDERCARRNGAERGERRE